MTDGGSDCYTAAGMLVIVAVMRGGVAMVLFFLLAMGKVRNTYAAVEAIWPKSPGPCDPACAGGATAAGAGGAAAVEAGRD